MAEQALDTLAALEALVAQAVAAGAAADAARMFREAPPALLAPFVEQVANRWLDSFRASVPDQTVVIVESDLEDLVAALAKGKLEAAAEIMGEVLAWHPQTGSPDPALPLLGAGLRMATGGEPAAAAAPPAEAPPPAAPPAPAPAPAVSTPAPAAAPASPPPAATLTPASVPVTAPPPPPRPGTAVLEAPGAAWIRRGLESLAANPAIALDCFERAIERSPEELGGWVGKGRALTALGRHAEALPACEHLLKVEPLDGRYWWAYANCLAALGQLPAALQAFERTVTLLPDAPGPRATRDRLAAHLAARR